MKANEADILIISDHADTAGDYWQRRWQAKLSTAKMVTLGGKDEPDLGNRADAVIKAAESCVRPIVAVAHSWAVTAFMSALPHLRGRICGGFFVCPPDISRSPAKTGEFAGFYSYPHDHLPFPSIVIASRNDPLCDYKAAEKLAGEWHSLFMDAGDAGHIDAESGHGPWPEGLIVFSQFLANLPKPSEHTSVQDAEDKIEQAGKSAAERIKE